MVVVKVFSPSETIFKVDTKLHKVNIASIDITLMSLLQYLDTLLSTLFTSEDIMFSMSKIDQKQYFEKILKKSKINMLM